MPNMVDNISSYHGLTHRFLLGLPYHGGIDKARAGHVHRNLRVYKLHHQENMFDPLCVRLSPPNHRARLCANTSESPQHTSSLSESRKPRTANLDAQYADMPAAPAEE